MRRRRGVHLNEMQPVGEKPRRIWVNCKKIIRVIDQDKFSTIVINGPHLEPLFYHVTETYAQVTNLLDQEV